MAPKDEPVRGIVLSGGGARGAYEAGVLAYIFRELPQQLLRDNPIRLFSGTSVGAVHGCFLAACAHMPHNNVESLLQVWRSFKLESMLRTTGPELLRLPLDLHNLFRKREQVNGLLINVSGLQNIVMREIPWRRMQQNLESGLVDAVTVSATHIHSGKTVVFIDRPNGGAFSWTRDARRLARGTRIGPMHALASAAIPLLFPAIPIDGAYYCDGGLRQNTPLSPALRLGANRVLVIPVGHGRDVDVPERAEESSLPEYPGPALLMGKVFNALLLDHLDYDLAQLNGFNRLLQDGAAAFGDDFLKTLSGTAQRIRGASYRHVDTMVVRPSRDLGEMAAEFVMAHQQRMGKITGWMLRKVSAEDALHNSDLLSYICFDGAFSRSLIELGMADADAARAKLIDFFS